MKTEIIKLYKYLRSKNKEGSKILFLTTSNRWSGANETPKSSYLAIKLKENLSNCDIVDVSKLKIFPCEGNVSREEGNRCGLKESMLKDDKKNPHKFIRCWASINNPSDEMYIVANKIYESDIIIFFGSIRWGKMNSIYTNLIERLTWIENIKNSLSEKNILENKEAGIVAMGHNWNSQDSVKLEKEVLDYYGFKTPDVLSFNRQWTNDDKDESLKGYKKDFKDFYKEIEEVELTNESLFDFEKWIDLLFENNNI